MNLQESNTAPVTIHPELMGPVMGLMDYLATWGTKYSLENQTDIALQCYLSVTQQIKLYNQTTSQLQRLESNIQNLFHSFNMLQQQGE